MTSINPAKVTWHGVSYSGYRFSDDYNASLGKVSETPNGLRLAIEGQFTSYAELKKSLLAIAKALP